MALRSDNKWEKKYHFDELNIGESVEVCGVESNIRSAASMWGTRYGVWLQVTRIDDGYCRVTRLEAPVKYRQKQLTKHEQVCERLDAIANLLRLVLEKLNGQTTNSDHSKD